MYKAYYKCFHSGNDNFCKIDRLCVTAAGNWYYLCDFHAALTAYANPYRVTIAKIGPG